MALPLFWVGLPLFTSALKTSKQLKKIIIPLLISCCISFLASAQISQNNLAQLDSAFGPQSFFDGHLSGFMLYDLESKQVVFEKNSHLYQIPASTVKLLTLFGALQVLQDSTQTVRYQSAGDTLKIWGSGDPSWKYKDFYQPDFQKSNFQMPTRFQPPLVMAGNGMIITSIMLPNAVPFLSMATLCKWKKLVIPCSFFPNHSRIILKSVAKI